jgi:hypothetical protein
VTPNVTRPYTGSKRWALLARREEIPDSLRPKKVYLRRWRIVQTPWFGLYLHQIWGADTDRDAHNHPFGFVSLMLRGGYDEWVQDLYGDVAMIVRRRPLRFHHTSRQIFHRIITLGRVPAWTLVFVGRRHPEWGFSTEQGYVPSHKYQR